MSYKPRFFYFIVVVFFFVFPPALDFLGKIMMMVFLGGDKRGYLR